MYDIVIIGSGPGGYVAAIRAAQLGLRAAVVEREHLAGICSNWGCIPTKALLRSAELMDFIGHAETFGVALPGPAAPDLPAMVARSRRIAERMNSGVGFLLRKSKVDVIWGEGSLVRAPTADRPGEIAVVASARPARQPQAPLPKGALGPGRYQAKHIIVATGARPRSLPGIEVDGDRVWSYFEAMVPPSLPKSLLVVGSGAIGIEFASFYRSLGTEVTVVEVLPRILPVEDADVAAFAQKQFEKRGIRFRLGAKVARIERGPEGVTADVERGDGTMERITAERVISAVGVTGNVEGLGLEAVGVVVERGTITVDGFGRTNVVGIYAIGDVAGAPMLAHKAEHEGVLCVEAIAGKMAIEPLDRTRIPGCTYGAPQVASVGLTEARAREAGHAVRVGRFPFAGNGKAIALGEDQGFVKTVFDAGTGKLLGAHLVGAEVTELIHGFVVAMNLETTEQELMHTIFPHPTLSEMMKESVLDAYGEAINI